jgi:hypothetical protein
MGGPRAMTIRLGATEAKSWGREGAAVASSPGGIRGSSARSSASRGPGAGVSTRAQWSGRGLPGAADATADAAAG